jgi:hypothetical protein
MGIESVRCGGLIIVEYGLASGLDGLDGPLA